MIPYFVTMPLDWFLFTFTWCAIYGISLICICFTSIVGDLINLLISCMFLSAIIYPSLLQLQKGVTDVEDKRQKVVCSERYKRRDEDERQFSDIDTEREEECGICMEMNSKIVLPNCNHAMCMRCYRDWYFFYSQKLYVWGKKRFCQYLSETLVHDSFTWFFTLGLFACYVIHVCMYTWERREVLTCEHS